MDQHVQITMLPVSILFALADWITYTINKGNFRVELNLLMGKLVDTCWKSRFFFFVGKPFNAFLSSFFDCVGCRCCADRINCDDTKKFYILKEVIGRSTKRFFVTRGMVGKSYWIWVYDRFRLRYFFSNDQKNVKKMVIEASLPAPRPRCAELLLKFAYL